MHLNYINYLLGKLFYFCILQVWRREVRYVDHWLSINKMTVNTKKIEVIFFENKTQLKKLDNITRQVLFGYSV